MAKQGNGLGEGNAKSWNPGSVRPYGGVTNTGQAKSGQKEMRPGAGQKGSK